MSAEHLAIYLNDHRAGAGSALDLLSHIEKIAELTVRVDDRADAAAQGALGIPSRAE
jgi:hypothetical protein